MGCCLEPTTADEAQGRCSWLLCDSCLVGRGNPSKSATTNFASTIGAIASLMVILSMPKNVSDISYDQWLVQIAMALAQTLAIVTACVPYLKPFMDGLESGMIRSDDLLRRTEVPGKRGVYPYGRDRKSPLNSAISKRLSKMSNPTRPVKPHPHEMDPIKSAIINTVSVEANPYHERDWDVGSDSSQTKIIKQTRSWGVVSSDAAELGMSDQDSR
jgi:hypothetical protein